MSLSDRRGYDSSLRVSLEEHYSNFASSNKLFGLCVAPTIEFYHLCLFDIYIIFDVVQDETGSAILRCTSIGTILAPVTHCQLGIALFDALSIVHS